MRASSTTAPPWWRTARLWPRAIGGTFDLLQATGDFVLDVAGGIAIGIVAGAVLVKVFRKLVGDDVVGVVLSLAAGYIAYIPAEEIGVSGVLAAVGVGLIVGYHAPEISTPASRLRGYGFWEVLVFLLNAVLFVLVGLQLPAILEAQNRSAIELIGLAALISAVVIGTRMLWVNTTPYVLRAIDRRPQQVARRVGWRQRQIAGWSGLRGSVSLAAALALPFGFPERDLLIFLTLAVIFATLVAQGLTLPYLIRKLGIEDDGVAAREELHARREATAAAIEHLSRLGEEDWTRDDTIDRMIAALRVPQPPPQPARGRARPGRRRGQPRRALIRVSAAGARGPRRPAPPGHRAAQRRHDLRRGAALAGARAGPRGPAARNLSPPRLKGSDPLSLGDP